MSRLGELLYAKSIFTAAEPLMRRALEILEASLGPEHLWAVTARATWK